MAAGATRDCAAASRFLFLTTVGNHGLLPLLFTPAEYPIKVRALAGTASADLGHSSVPVGTTITAAEHSSSIWSLMPKTVSDQVAYSTRC